ncbi:MAG: YbaB/EbfC family nucleoid-associated protein [Planctomycetota bacterium]|jgi:DNA-binding YbaB/EbfC family protein|nr:YbaB/EbfC family nucleoid-associated protein [Planctomycetota bacterium]
MTGIGDFFEMAKNARQMMEKAKEARESLAKRIVQGNAGAGMVVASMSGAGELLRIKFERTAITPDDPEMLSDLVVAAVADARKKADGLKADILRDLAGGLDLSSLGLDLSGLL